MARVFGCRVHNYNGTKNLHRSKAAASPRIGGYGYGVKSESDPIKASNGETNDPACPGSGERSAHYTRQVNAPRLDILLVPPPPPGPDMVDSEAVRTSVAQLNRRRRLSKTA